MGILHIYGYPPAFVGVTLAKSEGSASKEAEPFHRIAHLLPGMDEMELMKWPYPACPKCHSSEVKPVWIYPISPLWACQNPRCLHQWPRDVIT